MQPSNTYTGGDGCAHSTFQAPDVVGAHQIATYAAYSSHFMDVIVLYNNLSPLPSHADYDKVGAQWQHPDGWWGTANAVSKIQDIAMQFRQETGLKIGVNDMSIRWGGRFDLGPSYGGAYWKKPHTLHTRGLNVDIPFGGLGTPSQRERFFAIATAQGGRPEPHGGNHYHLSFTY